MRIAGIHHFAIKVRDLPAAERFYREVLGLLVARRWPEPSGAGDRSVWLFTGDDEGTFLALEKTEGAAMATATAATADGGGTHVPDVADAEPPGRDATTAELSGHHLLALRIGRHERRAWEKRLGAAGVNISRRSAYTLYFGDPEGNRLGLSHHPHPIDDEKTGTDAGDDDDDGDDSGGDKRTDVR